MSDAHPLMLLLARFRETESLGFQGRSFERLVKWWLLSDPEFQARYERIDKPSQDIGVDLCAFPRNGGKPTAVQCKQYVGEIPKREIDSFLSAAATDEFADSLLVHTGTGFSSNAARTIKQQQTPCSVVTLARLLRSDVRWPNSVRDLGSGVPPAPRSPRTHQQEALGCVRSAFFAGRPRTWVNMACGSGKTLVGTLVADEFAHDLAIVFVATGHAVHEAVRAWRRDSRVAFSELRVCSKQEFDGREIADSEELRAPVTTDEARIEVFLSGDGRRVIFCTYASAPRVADAARSAGVTFDLVIGDDAHHICSRRKSTKARSVLDNESLPARHRLFLTATPRTIDPRAQLTATRRGSPLVDMRDHGGGDFGNRVYHLSYRAAVERGIVLPFEVHIVQVITTEVSRVVTSRRMIAGPDHTEAVLASLAVTQIASIEAAADLQLQRIVAFHDGVAESETFARQFEATASLVRDVGSVPAARHVDYYDNARRRRTIEWFETATAPSLLSNAKLLAEGVDSPNIDAIIWNDPNPPAGRIVQAVGRALRAAPGKSKAVVIVPMIIGPDGNVERAREFSNFRSTLEILDALRTIDPNFTISRESIRFYAAKRASSSSERYATSAGSIVAPLEVTDAFADAIQHLTLPPKAPAHSLASGVPITADAQRSERSRQSRPTASSRAEATPWYPLRWQRPSEVFSNGLERLEALSGDRLLFQFDDADWLRMLHLKFRKRRLRDEDLHRVASHLSFLARGLGARTSGLRALLALHADQDVSAQLLAWIQARPSPSRAHGLHAIAYGMGWPVDELVARLHSLLTHPGIAPVSQARLSLQPLLIATDGIGHDEDPSSRLAGVMAALEHPWDAVPCQTPAGWRPDSSTDAARADWQTYEAGWTVARSWRAQARLISRLDVDTYRHDIQWAAAREARRHPQRRWDCTAWIVYINELADSRRGRTSAARTASLLPYRERVRRAQHLLATPVPLLAVA